MGEEHKIACEQVPVCSSSTVRVIVAVGGRPRPNAQASATRGQVRVRRPKIVGGMMRTSPINSSPMIRRNASR